MDALPLNGLDLMLWFPYNTTGEQLEGGYLHNSNLHLFQHPIFSPPDKDHVLPAPY
jgi:hypothetical protein